MKVAVTGYKGRLGSELVSKWGCLPLDCDILSRPSIHEALYKVNPDIVIHCAAMTDVDQCEKQMYESFEINVRGTENIKICFDGKIIFLSTDYIFDGKKGMYSEGSEYSVYPKISWYGYTKLLGEELLGNTDTIVRTTMLYGSPLKMDFVTKILQQLELDEPFKVTRALYGTPTYVPHLAEAIMKMVELPKLPHVVNIVGSDCLSRYEFALMIAAFFDHRDKNKLIVPTLKIGKTKRPRKAGLNINLAKKLGLPIYSVLEGLEAFHKSDKVNIYKHLGMDV